MKTELYIQTALRNGQTYLAKSFSTSPLKVANITEDKKGQQLRLMIMSSSPGILDGDEYDLKIDVDAGCNLDLQTQSYHRLFTMQRSASQTMEVNVAKGSYFSYISHPTVPHVGSAYKASSKIYLNENSTLLWGEVITCGRKLNGEHFQFSRLQVLTDVFINKKLVVKENLFLEPSKTAVTALGHWEGYTHQASLMFINSIVSMIELIQMVSDLLNVEKDITFGVSLAPVNGLIVRILGYKGEQLFECLKRIALLLSLTVVKSLPVYAA